MFRCNDCGWEFETPAVECEDDSDDTYDACPSCGSDDILFDVDELEDDE